MVRRGVPALALFVIATITACAALLHDYPVENDADARDAAPDAGSPRNPEAAVHTDGNPDVGALPDALVVPDAGCLKACAAGTYCSGGACVDCVALRGVCASDNACCPEV